LVEPKHSPDLAAQRRRHVASLPGATVLTPLQLDDLQRAPEQPLSVGNSSAQLHTAEVGTLLSDRHPIVLREPSDLGDWLLERFPSRNRELLAADPLTQLYDVGGAAGPPASTLLRHEMKGDVERGVGRQAIAFVR
jgi:hypothetical protein